MKYVFVGNVKHDGVDFGKGVACPAAIHDEMLKKGLIAPLPEAVEPPKAAEPKAEPKSEKAKK